MFLTSWGDSLHSQRPGTKSALGGGASHLLQAGKAFQGRGSFKGDAAFVMQPSHLQIVEDANPPPILHLVGQADKMS